MNNEYPRIESFKENNPFRCLLLKRNENNNFVFVNPLNGELKSKEYTLSDCINSGRFSILSVAKSKDEVFTVGEETKTGKIKEFYYWDDWKLFVRFEDDSVSFASNLEKKKEAKYPMVLSRNWGVIEIINEIPILTVGRDKDIIFSINDKVYFNNPNSHLYGKELTITGFKENEKGNLLAITNLTNKNGLRVDKLLTAKEWSDRQPKLPKQKEEKKEELCVPIRTKFTCPVDKPTIIYTITKVIGDKVNIAWTNGYDKNYTFSIRFVNECFEYGKFVVYEKKKPLFKTEDGVEVFKNTELYYVRLTEPSSRSTDKQWSVAKYNSVNEECALISDYKWFHKKEAAEKWIEDNKPRFSKKEIEGKSIIGKNYVPSDNSYSVNVTKSGNYPYKNEPTYLAGTCFNIPKVCTILSEPFECDCYIHGISNPKNIHTMIMVRYNQETHMVLFDKKNVR